MISSYLLLSIPIDMSVPATTKTIAAIITIGLTIGLGLGVGMGIAMDVGTARGIGIGIVFTISGFIGIGTRDEESISDIIGAGITYYFGLMCFVAFIAMPIVFCLYIIRAIGTQNGIGTLSIDIIEGALSINTSAPIAPSLPPPLPPSPPAWTSLDPSIDIIDRIDPMAIVIMGTDVTSTAIPTIDSIDPMVAIIMAIGFAIGVVLGRINYIVFGAPEITLPELFGTPTATITPTPTVAPQNPITKTNTERNKVAEKPFGVATDNPLKH